LITGEVDRTTEFERGMPPAHVRGRGLVVLTGCGHAGVVNILRHATRLTGVHRLHALIGGLHLSGPAFEPATGSTRMDRRRRQRAHARARSQAPPQGPSRERRD
jgi:7,8-dihydropterin-6-yl-methyl-4-(beta-D-ribofuranosyl)aminobenzene 5'-phosphate synthase